MGIALADVLQRCAPLPGPRRVVFRGVDEHLGGEPYHETIDLELARDLQTLLADDMNGARPSIRTGHHAGCVWRRGSASRSRAWTEPVGHWRTPSCLLEPIVSAFLQPVPIRWTVVSGAAAVHA